MKIKLHELSQPLEISLTSQEGWVRAVFTRLKTALKGPFSLFMKVEKDKDVIFIEGHLNTTFVLNCARCANEMDYRVDEFFSPVFIHGREPKDHGTHTWGTSASSAHSPDATYFQSNEIDLGEVLQEQIVLAAPYQPLCSPACKGICQQCGQDLNAGSCQCEKGGVKSPFSVLKTVQVAQFNQIKKKKRRR